MIESYGLWNDSRGNGRRAVIVIDKEGTVRYRQEYAPGSLPNPAQILEIVEKFA